MNQPLMSSTKLSIESLSHDIFPLIVSLRPNWSPSNTDLQQFTGGINNTTFGLCDKLNRSDGLVIKIYGSKTEEFIDRNAESDTLNILSKYGFAQPILLRFVNGVIYQYIPGEICSRDDIRDVNIVPLIASYIAKLHSIPIEDKISRNPCLIPLMRKFLTLIDKTDHFHYLSSEVDWIEFEVLPRLFPQPQYGIDLVLCHNDIVCKNILYNSSSRSISFIDFEYCAINFALFDIANLFVEYAGVEQIDFDRYPTRIEQQRWLKIYFEARNLDFLNPEAICDQIDQLAALSHLCFGLWAIAHVCVMKDDPDCLAYGQRRLNRYRELKEKLFFYSVNKFQ